MTILPAPAPELQACVVVPAHDEEALVGACVRALAAQERVAPEACELLLVLDRCSDATEARAREAAGRLTLHVLHASAPGVGAARRLGMDLACERLHAAGRPDGLIACTDADSEVARNWLATQLDAVAAGARAIGGRAAMANADLETLGPQIRSRREQDAAARLARAREQAARGTRTEHHQFSGASMALTAEAYRLAGPLEPRTGLEDEGLERLLRRHGIPIDRLLAVRVTTSARVTGRAPRGLAVDLRRARWLAERRYDGAAYRAAELAERRTATVSVIAPAAAPLDPLLRAGLVDEVVETGAAGGVPGFGPSLGRGDALWRALADSSGELVAVAGTAAAAIGLLGPLLEDPELLFVKGAPAGADPVAELVARPLLNLHLPDLASVLAPLATEIAARRALLERLAFPVGGGVDVALLIDAHREAGLERMAQVDLPAGAAHPEPDAERALAVLYAAERRIHGPARAEAQAPGHLLAPAGDGFEARPVALDERPPLAALEPAAA